MKRYERRILEYDFSNLPNNYVAELERTSLASSNFEQTMSAMGGSIGYPAWNLLYYILLTSFPFDQKRVNVIETGTSFGFSTIILAQALKDFELEGFVHTIELDEKRVDTAKENVHKAGVNDLVKFYVGDSREILKSLVVELSTLHFVFLDGVHSKQGVLNEFALIHSAVKRGRGKVFFDNVSHVPIAEALQQIKKEFKGNLITFDNCSWGPAGCSLWQA